MYNYPVSYLIQLVLETAAFLVIAGVGLARWREGLWAVLATVGGALALITAALQLTVYAEAKYFDSSHVADFVLGVTDQVSNVLGWTRVVGVVLIAAALAVSTRSSAPGRRERSEGTF
ncbi:hypothetical protein [Nocardioides ungokensis]|uniref:hypothetical protein n=1 Tax=Nocardioides ungokensis TaxID=1643322 RepID=UPI0015E01700|nr:hypothetical protein [Nocardioides ungokensis]